MRHDLYITGTDTDVGKTYVTVRLMRALAQQTNRRILGMKPVASGCENGKNADALAIQNAGTHSADYADINPFALTQAIAPEFAAQDSGVHLSLPPIQAACARLRAQCDQLLVEGAGGWLSPVSAELDQCDVANALEITDVVLVVGIQLGGIHHARATAQAIKDSGMQLVGWVANEVKQHDPQFDRNVQAIARYIDAPLLARVRHGDDDINWLRLPS